MKGKYRIIVENKKIRYDFGAGRFNIKVLNTEKIVHNMSELLDEAMAYV